MTDTVFRRAYERTRASSTIAIELARKASEKIRRDPPRQHSACGTRGCPYCDR